MDASGFSPPTGEPEKKQHVRPPRRPSPVALLIGAVLVIGGGYYLTVKLRDMGRLQDCAMSGRPNCAPIEQSSSP